MASPIDRVVIRPAEERDIPPIAQINVQSFAGNQRNLEAASRDLSPKLYDLDHYLFFVAEVDRNIAGYIIWQLRGGLLRAMPVVELLQIAVAKNFERQGIGSKLQEDTIPIVKRWICGIFRSLKCEIGDRIKIIVEFYEEKSVAETLYKKHFPEIIGWGDHYGKRQVMRGGWISISPEDKKAHSIA